jgi:hypothetical protein
MPILNAVADESLDLSRAAHPRHGASPAAQASPLTHASEGLYHNDHFS